MNKDKAFWVGNEPLELSRKKIKQPKVIKDTPEETITVKRLGNMEVTHIQTRKEFVTNDSFMFIMRGAEQDD